MCAKLQRKLPEISSLNLLPHVPPSIPPPPPPLLPHPGLVVRTRVYPPKSQLHPQQKTKLKKKDRLTSQTRQPQLLPHIHIPFLIHPPSATLLFGVFQQFALVPLPHGAAVYATGRRGGGGGPLLEAFRVDVVAAGGFAVDYVFGGEGGEFRVADWAVAFDGFAVAVDFLPFFFFRLLCWRRWGVFVGGGGGRGWLLWLLGSGYAGLLGEDLAELGGEKCDLVSEVLGGFEDVVEDVDNVFALVSLFVVRAGAAGFEGDCYVVDVPRCAGHFDGFGGDGGGAGAGAGEDEHSVFAIYFLSVT